MMSETRRRVKLYILNEDRQWDDSGTGHITLQMNAEDNQNASVLIRSEEDGSVLLDSKIEQDVLYQKQQETLIVWTENDQDVAISFQEKLGCDEIWEKICSIQGRDPSSQLAEEEEEQFEETSEYHAISDLPPCEIGRLEDISEIFTSSLPSPVLRERLCNTIEERGYIQQLAELFRICEDLENTEGLHRLHGIFRALFAANKNALFEIMLSDDLILDIIGILEYDPARSERAQHRKYMNEVVKFREVIPITNKDLKEKIHQTFKVQFIHDILCPSPSFFEDSYTTLNSIIFFKKVEIVTTIQEDDRFLSELFRCLLDDEIPDDRRKELVMFLRELCIFSQSLQHGSRESFIRELASHNMFKMVETLMNLDDAQIKGALVDVVVSVAEVSPSLIREFMMTEALDVDEDSILLNLLINLMIAHPDGGHAMQIVGVVKALLDPDNMTVMSFGKMEKTEFLTFFFKHCMHVLIAPLTTAVAGSGPIKDDTRTATCIDHIVGILTFMVEHDTQHTKSYVISKGLGAKVLRLLGSKHAFLTLDAVRFLRKIIGLKDESYIRHIISERLFEPIVIAFQDNGDRYNLLNSSVIEIFEFIKTEDIKPLVAHVVEEYGYLFKTISYVKTFETLLLRHEQEKDRQRTREEEETNKPQQNTSTASSRYRRDDREPDQAEDAWFNSDDDSDDADNISTPPHASTEHSSPKSSPNRLLDVDLIDNIPVARRSPPSLSLDGNSSGSLPAHHVRDSKRQENNHIRISLSENSKRLLSTPPSTSKRPVENHRPSTPGLVTSTKFKIASVGLVDYPDDDDDEDGHGKELDDVGHSAEKLASPSKKARLN